MIRVVVYKRTDQSYSGIKVSGHAGYAEYGSDIVCAGVSALVLNAINSLEAFTDDKLELKRNEKTGLIAFKFRGRPGTRAELLMDSLILGLQGIAKENNAEYINIIFKEV